MAHCLITLSNYQNQCFLIIRQVEYIHLVILQEISQPPTTKIGWKITCLNFRSDLPWLNELNGILEFRDDSKSAPNQWEMPLQSNTFSLWLDANLESTLEFVQSMHCRVVWVIVGNNWHMCYIIMMDWLLRNMIWREWLIIILFFTKYRLE